MTQQQKIFKAIVLHNKLLGEADLVGLFEHTPDPDEVINKMVIGEMIDEMVAEKLRSLYAHNLKKQGLPSDVSPAHAEAGHGHRHEIHGAPEVVNHPQAHAHATVHAHAPVRPSIHEPMHAHDNAHAHAHAVAHDTSHERPPQAQVSRARFGRSEGGDLVLKLLGMARQMKASDLHLMAGAVPSVRVASILRDLEMPEVSPHTVESALKSLLTPAQLEEFERRNDLDCSFDGGAELGRFRLNMLRQLRGVGESSG